jgi:seryl-tRNA synthetase
MKPRCSNWPSFNTRYPRCSRGFTPVITPDLARVEVLEGIGFMPRDPNPETRQVYTIADTDLCLVATAEITLAHAPRTNPDEALPLRHAGLSHCFTRPRPAVLQALSSINSIKVEMFAFCTAGRAKRFT